MGFFGDLGKALGGGGGGGAGGGGGDRRKEDKTARSNKVTDPNTGKTYDKPSYGAASVKGLTSKDPANVARNQEAAARYNQMEKNKPESKDKKEPAARSVAPVAPVVPVAPVTPPVIDPTLIPPPAPAPVIPVGGTTGTTGTTPGSTVEGAGAANVPVSTGAGSTTASGGRAEAELIRAEATGDAERAVADTAEQGRRSTVLTTSLGLLADQEAEGVLRPRRSLLGRGMIQ